MKSSYDIVWKHLLSSTGDKIGFILINMYMILLLIIYMSLFQWATIKLTYSFVKTSEENKIADDSLKLQKASILQNKQRFVFKKKKKKARNTTHKKNSNISVVKNQDYYLEATWKTKILTLIPAFVGKVTCC